MPLTALSGHKSYFFYSCHLKERIGISHIETKKIVSLYIFDICYIFYFELKCVCMSIKHPKIGMSQKDMILALLLLLLLLLFLDQISFFVKAYIKSVQISLNTNTSVENVWVSLRIGTKYVFCWFIMIIGWVTAMRNQNSICMLEMHLIVMWECNQTLVMRCMLILDINHKKVNLTDFHILFLVSFLLWWIVVKICTAYTANKHYFKNSI